MIRATRDRVSSWLAGFGPALVFAVAVVGMGDFVTNASLGAAHGYSFLWLLALGVAFRFVWLDTSARYVLTTGEGLISGLTRLGRPITLSLLLVAPVLGHLTNLARIVLFSRIAQLLVPLPGGHGAAIYGAAFVAAVLVAILRGGYPWLERFSRWLILGLGVGLAAAALFSHPSPAGILRGLIPSVPATSDVKATLLMVTALIGTEAGSLTNLTYASFLSAKQWRDASAIRMQRRDLIQSVGAIFIVGALTQIAAASTMAGSGIRIQTADDLVHVVGDSLGSVGVLLVALGLAAKVFSSSVGGTTGYAMVIAELGRQLAPTSPNPESPSHGSQSRAVGWIAVVLMVTPLYGLFTNWTPVTLVLVSQAATVVLIPVLTLGLVRLTRARGVIAVGSSDPLRIGVMLAMTLVSLWILWHNVVVWTAPALSGRS
jgi:Mn2+/Fe2+ NRAMP family transporter